jgi:DNA polymerase-3 subunit epsilon
MMRQIVLDTETTGLDPESGHRIIEIGCVEIESRRTTERRYHQYINPKRAIDPGAIEVHGLTTEFLSAKPIFSEVLEEFLAYATGAELIIHNAPFDIGFLNAELKHCASEVESISDLCKVTDTLTMARNLHPGQRNSLDALCRRYEVDNTHRDLHGALLDAELLADVYLAMTGGQVDLQLAAESSAKPRSDISTGEAARSLVGIPVVQPTIDELAAHQANLERIDAISGNRCVWLSEVGTGNSS